MCINGTDDASQVIVVDGGGYQNAESRDAKKRPDHHYIDSGKISYLT